MGIILILINNSLIDWTTTSNFDGKKKKWCS